MSECDRQRFIALQPVRRLQEFARLLGWNDLRIRAFRCPESPAGYVAAYCTTDCTTDERFNLQIIPRRDAGELGYSATVVAERYGFTAVPRQPFTLFTDRTALAAEANRLRSFLARSNFKDPHWRKQFAMQNPIWIMRQYRRRNKFLAEVRRRALQLAREMRSHGINPYQASATPT